MTSRITFQLLNTTVEVTDSESWNDASKDKLLLYHLHYFGDLQAHDASSRVEWHHSLIDKWIRDNPVLIGNGWEPYPLSLRIVNWVKWALTGNTLSSRALQSLRVQARVLEQSVEYHLLANHILANAKALVFAGAFFEGPAAKRWLHKGMKLLGVQLDEQILADGGHFELSPMYHSIVLEDLLDLINVSRAYELTQPTNFSKVAGNMLKWLFLMTHPDGRLSYFNDATLGVGPSFKSLEKYALRLGILAPSHEIGASVVLRDSGYVRFATNKSVILIDIGNIGPDYQPGHGHCDCLSFEISLGARRIFVNRGVSTYNACDRRTDERSTGAHNTVSIDEQEQSEVWSAFRVGRRARPRNIEFGKLFVEGEHDGYSNLGLIHRRRFEIQEDLVRIVDFLEGPNASKHEGTAHFHFHPDVDAILEHSNVRFSGGQLEFTNADTVEIDAYEYCLGFSNRRTGTIVHARFRKKLQTEITFLD